MDGCTQKGVVWEGWAVQPLRQAAQKPDPGQRRSQAGGMVWQGSQKAIQACRLRLGGRRCCPRPGGRPQPAVLPSSSAQSPVPTASGDTLTDLNSAAPCSGPRGPVQLAHPGSLAARVEAAQIQSRQGGRWLNCSASAPGRRESLPALPPATLPHSLTCHWYVSPLSCLKCLGPDTSNGIRVCQSRLGDVDGQLQGTGHRVTSPGQYPAVPISTRAPKRGALSPEGRTRWGASPRHRPGVVLREGWRWLCRPEVT